MTSKVKGSVKRARTVPRAKAMGVVRKTREWQLACAKIDAGELVEVSLGTSLDGQLTNPVIAFTRALKRRYVGKHVQVYAVKGVIYAVPKSVE
jgi:hypothetical protein